MLIYIAEVDPSQLSDVNETVHAVWNTVAGGNSPELSSAMNFTIYVTGEDPINAFDNNTSTKYLNYGTCNDSSYSSTVPCSINTGLYVSLQQGPSLLAAFQFCTADSAPPNDPLMVNVEGSNQPASLLTLGSSWILLYNGSSGLYPNPGRSACGKTQWLSSNSIWCTSYRILTTSTRGTGSFVQYSELILLGY